MDIKTIYTQPPIIVLELFLQDFRDNKLTQIDLFLNFFEVQSRFEKYKEDMYRILRKFITSLETENKLDKGNAFYILGLLNLRGFATPKDSKKAIQLFEEGVKLEHTGSMCSLGTIFREGKVVEKDLVRARELFEHGMKLNDSNAINNLGELYLYGEGVDKNYRSAKEHFSNAEKLQNSSAIYNIALMYIHSYGVIQSFLTARKYLIKAESLNNIAAMRKLGKMYAEGWVSGEPADSCEAKKHYLNAVKLRSSEAMHDMALMYLELDDRWQAMCWLMSAITYGNIDSMFSLAKLYFDEATHPFQWKKKMIREEAMILTRKAAEGGHLEATRLLGKWSQGSHRLGYLNFMLTRNYIAAVKFMLEKNANALPQFLDELRTTPGIEYYEILRCHSNDLLNAYRGGQDRAFNAICLSVISDISDFEKSETETPLDMTLVNAKIAFIRRLSVDNLEEDKISIIISQVIDLWCRETKFTDFAMDILSKLLKKANSASLALDASLLNQIGTLLLEKKSIINYEPESNIWTAEGILSLIYFSKQTNSPNIDRGLRNEYRQLLPEMGFFNANTRGSRNPNMDSAVPVSTLQITNV